MSATYYFCTSNNYMALLQPKLYDPTWNVSTLLSFLRCIPLNYDLIEKEIKQKSESYYLIYDQSCGPFFNIYLKEPIQIVTMRPPRIPITVYTTFFRYKEVSSLYKKSSSVNFDVTIYQFNLHLNMYSIGTKKATSSYKISKASFKILKKLALLYPNNIEISAEKLFCINEYSNQQKLNIYKSLSIDVDLITILKSLNGFVKVFIHSTKENEIKYDDASTVHGFC